VQRCLKIAYARSIVISSLEGGIEIINEICLKRAPH